MNYYISGVWKSNGAITHVLLHVAAGTSLNAGTKATEAFVISLLDSTIPKNTIETITWNYISGSWHRGAVVGYETVYQRKILRTWLDGRVSNNLDNLIGFTDYIAGF